MPWFKVDDGLASNANITRIPRAHRRAALGLWVLAGSWSAGQLTDGHVPAHMLEELSGVEEDARWLVDVGIWEVVPDGWQFVTWGPDQPLRELVIADREKRAAKQRTWRSRNQVSNPVTDTPTNDHSDAATDASVPQSRPDPTRPDPIATSNEVVIAHRDEDSEFDQWWAVYPRKQGKAEAEKVFSKLRKTVPLKTLIDGAQSYALLNITQEKTFLKLPAGWLRGERWNDEEIVPPEPTAASQRNIATVEHFRQRETPEERARRTMALVDECPSHPGYPAANEWRSCVACEREEGQEAVGA